MLWWTHGIFISVLLITIILKVISGLSYEVSNAVIDGIADFADNLFDNMIFMAAVILSGTIAPFVYYYIILMIKDTYMLNILTLTYKVKKFELLSEDLQTLVTKQVDEYMEPIWDSYSTGFSVCTYIVLGFIGIVLVSSLIAALVNKDKNKRQTDIEKIKYAYMVAKESKSPEVKEVAKVLEKTLKKIEFQKELDKISGGLKAAKAIQSNSESNDVQKDLDTILAMMQLNEDEISVLAKKYDKLNKQG